jgi:hypothetical protein
MSGEHLEYAPPPPVWRRKRARRLIFALIFLLLAVVGIFQRRTIELYARQAELLYAQRAWLNFSAPADRVVYDDDPARAAALLALPDYARVYTPQGKAAVVWTPPQFSDAWFRTSGRPPSPTAVLFLHERRTAAGERFLLSCELEPAQGLAGSSTTPIHMSEIRRAGWRRGLARRNSVGWSLPGQIQRAIQAGAHLRVFAGQADPGDATHFTVKYDLDGVEGILDGYEGDRTEDANGIPTPGLRLEMRKPN